MGFPNRKVRFSVFLCLNDKQQIDKKIYNNTSNKIKN